MFHAGISTILFYLFSMIMSTLMMVQEASNLWNGFGAHAGIQNLLKGVQQLLYKIHALQATWKQGPECVLMDKIEGTYTVIVNYEFQK